MKMKCVLIDDEPMALDILHNYIKKIPYLTHLDSFVNSIEALNYIQQNDVDLIFLDIDMPDLTGIEFLNILDNKVLTIITTAYSEYALQSYDYNVVDYLLKPIAFERFLKATQRAHKLTDIGLVVSDTKDAAKERNIVIKSGSRNHFIKTNDIIMIQGAGNYLCFHLKDKKILSLLKMNEALDILTDEFVRVHKSYIVNKKYIVSIDKNHVNIDHKLVPISKTYKKSIRDSLK